MDTKFSKCCCFPIKVGTIIVAILEFIALVITLLAVITFYRHGGSGHATLENSQGVIMDLGQGGMMGSSSGYRAEKGIRVGSGPASLAVIVIVFLLGTAVTIALLIGVIKEKPKLVFVHLIAQGLFIILMLIGVLIFALHASNAIPITEEELKPDSLIVKENGEVIKDATLSPEDKTKLENDIRDVRYGVAVAFSVILSILTVILAGFMVVVHRCFKYLANKALQ